MINAAMMILDLFRLIKTFEHFINSKVVEYNLQPKMSHFLAAFALFFLVYSITTSLLLSQISHPAFHPFSLLHYNLIELVNGVEMQKCVSARTACMGSERGEHVHYI